MTEESLLEFPCDFPLKVMGKDSEQFRDAVIGIVRRHVSTEARPDLRPSRDGRFVSLSFMLAIDSRAQLDELYRELSANTQVLFVL